MSQEHRMMSARAREDEAVEAWCDAVSKMEGSTVTVISRPDRDSEGRGGCDAIVNRAGGKNAVEHTTIDAYLEQRLDTARYKQVFAPLEEHITREFPDSWIEIAVPAHAVPTGEDWNRLRETFFHRACEAVRSLPIMNLGDESFTTFTYSDIPFPMAVSRQALDTQNPTCLIERDVPGNRREQLEEGIARALRAKAQQLRAYCSEGATVLLLDFDDVALLNQDLVAEYFARSAAAEAQAVGEIDEVFLVDRRRSRIWIFPVKVGGRVYPDVPEFDQYRRELFSSTYGRSLPKD